MTNLYLRPFLSLLLLFILINAKDQYHIGIANHNAKWFIHCPKNNTRIINPVIDAQPLIPYQCPYPSLSIDILPVDIDLTFMCSLQSRLVWVMVDLYQYNVWLWTINVQYLNISIMINKKIQINDYKTEVTNETNQFIVINAFYIPFESLEFVSNENVEILIEMNQCVFYVNESLIWDDIIHNNCNSIESKTLYAQYSYCDFFPKSLHVEPIHDVQIEIFNDNTTSIPDINVVLSIDEDRRAGSTTHIQDYDLFVESYRKLLSALIILRRNSNLLICLLIFTLIILTLLILFFIYAHLYNFPSHTFRKSVLSID